MWCRSGRARPGSPPAPATCGSPTRATAPSPASTPDTYVKDSPITVGTGPVGIAVAAGAAWVANNLEGSLSRIDVEDLSVTARTLDEDGGAYGVAARGGDVWVSNEHAGTLMRVTADGELPAGRDRPAGAAPRSGWRSSGTTCGSPAPPAAARCTAAGSSPWSGQAGLEQFDGAPDTDLTLHYTRVHGSWPR